MLVSLSLSNYRSFHEEQTISFAASNRFSGTHESHAVQIPNSSNKVLRAGLIYGANGSGKSNLFIALRYLRSLAIKQTSKNSGTNRTPFRFLNREIPTEFDIQFISEKNLYRYFIKLNDEKILEEWLCRIVKDKEKIIFERIIDSNGKLVIEAPGIRKTKKRLHSLVEVGCPLNHTFLATCNSILEKEDLSTDIAAAINWFESKLIMIAPTDSFRGLARFFKNNIDFCDFASKIVKNSSTGIENFIVTKTEISREELREQVKEEQLEKITSTLNNDSEKIGAIGFRDGTEILIEKGESEHYYKIRVQAKHSTADGKSELFDLIDESDGTRRLLNLIPALHHLRKSSAVFFIDEIDRSMHPILVWNFLNYFLTTCSEGDRQIIVTTHESNLLDLELARRDEIWFIEKDANASSNLYPLSDFKVRKDLEIRKHYLQGRFGAIPFMGSFDPQLFEDECIK